jgi:ATP-dependent protease ClpP protease subunit
LDLDHTHYTTIKTVVQDTIIALKVGDEYEPGHSMYICPNCHKINPDSFDMYYLTGLKSMGGSFTLTMAIYNLLYRIPNDLTTIKCKAVPNTIRNSSNKKVLTTKTGILLGNRLGLTIAVCSYY